MTMLNRDLRSLADRLEAGEASPAEAAEMLRKLATHTPDEKCRRMVSYSRYLARFDDAWSWSIVNDSDSTYGGPKLISNRFTCHPSNLDTVIDFKWWSAADIDTFGRALCAVAEIVAAQDDGESEDW